jgi:hypothetical protein
MKRLVVLAAVLTLAGCSGAAGAPSPTPPTGVVTFSQATYSCWSAAGSGSSGGPTTKWTADLSDRAGGLKVTVVLAKKTTTGKESVVDQSDMAVSNPDFNQFSADGVRVGLLCNPENGQGDYVMRIVRPSDSKVLATGTFTIAP